MDSCKEDKLPAVYQPSFMIDNLLTRKPIDQNGGDFPTPLQLEHMGRTENRDHPVTSNGRVSNNGVPLGNE